MKRKIVIVILSFVILFCVALWFLASSLIAPQNVFVGEPPADLNAVKVEFPSKSGATVHGWLIIGSKGKGAIALMHGIRGSRLDLINHARFLSRAGYTVLLFDFQAHGESKGENITVGYLESRDAQAAVNFLREESEGEKIGVIAISMGGAAVLLAQPALNVDALVLEEVYPTIEQAVSNRLAERFGGWARSLTPFLTIQIKLRLGFSASELRPIEKINQNRSPKFFIVGAEDKYTTLEESKSLSDTANRTKEFWAVNGAGHQDLHSFAKQEYEQKVLSFFEKHLKN